MIREEYLNKRSVLMNAAKDLMAAGKTAEATAKMTEVEAMDAEMQAQVTAEANLNALNNQAVVPAAMQNAGAVETGNRFDSVEYRTAYMNFVCRNEPIPARFNTAGTTNTTTGSAVIPTTLQKEIIRELKSYGELFARVRKLNVQGGLNIPILSLKPDASWITEAAAQSAQQLTANTSVSFSYYGLECRIAQTMLANVVSLEEFEALFVPLAVEALVKAIEIAIIAGTGSGQPTGVTVDSRVDSSQKIGMNSTNIKKWDKWKSMVFAKMKKSYRDGIFIMAQGTFDAYIDGMVDSTGQPIGRVNYGIDGAETYRFGGREVLTVEDDILAPYDTASADDVFAVYMRPTDYIINSNMEMTTTQWADHDTNQVKTKVGMVLDGKLGDVNGVLLLKKSAT